MKKRYLFMSSFFMLATIFTVIYFMNGRNTSQSRRALEDQNAETVDTVKELRISAATKYVVESYDGTTGVVTNEERPVPAELAGMTRQELEEYVRDYNESVDVERAKEEPDQMEVVSFSKEKLVLREIYQGEEEETGFYLKIDGGEVVIYHNDQVTPYENTGILAEIIPEEERKQLEEGYYVANEKELYSILENLSS